MSIVKPKNSVLALDTSTPACSVALSYQGQRYSRRALASREHTRLILPMVDEVLVEAGITLVDVEVLAFTTGPGSFTGIRIGFGVAQGLAYGSGLPVIPVSTLEVMAVAAADEFLLSAGEYVMPMLDARMDEIYWAVFCVKEDHSLTRVQPDSLDAPENIEVALPDSAKLCVVGDGWNYADRLSLKPAQIHQEYYPDAVAVLAIASQRYKAGEIESIENVQPVYLRDKITWKKRQRLRG